MDEKFKSIARFLVPLLGRVFKLMQATRDLKRDRPVQGS